MRVLIVDDEVYAVEAIREMVDWEALGIGEVVSADSMKQAQKILTEKPCDIRYTAADRAQAEDPPCHALEFVERAGKMGKDPIVNVTAAFDVIIIIAKIFH